MAAVVDGKESNMNNNKILYRFLLILASIIWGFAFAFQTMGLDSIGAFYFNAIRLLMAAVCLIPVVKAYNHFNPKFKSTKILTKKQILPGLACGLVLGIASALQQYGLYYTSAGKSSFITALYIIMVPLIGIIMKTKPGAKIWISVLIAVIGMYFLCIKDGFTLNYGDILTFFCAIFFALQIIIIDKYGFDIHPIVLSITQFIVASSISFILALFNETISIANISDALIPLLYAGIASGAIAYTLQIIGQRKTPPAIASLLMSGESVFGAIGGFLILGQKLSVREIIGCALVFCSIILAQLPSKNHN